MEAHAEQKRARLEELIRLRDSVSATLDVSGLLFADEEGARKVSDSMIMDSILSIRRTELKLRHNVEVRIIEAEYDDPMLTYLKRKITSQTSVTFSGSHESHGRFARDKLALGVIHQYSPTLSFKVCNFSNRSLALDPHVSDFCLHVEPRTFWTQCRSDLF